MKPITSPSKSTACSVLMGKLNKILVGPELVSEVKESKDVKKFKSSKA